MGTKTFGKSKQTQTPRHAKVLISLEFVLVAVLSGWIFVEYLHNVFLQDYVKSTVESNASILEFAVPIGFAAIVASLYFQRRSESREAQAALRREETLRKINFVATPLPAQKIPHQVFAVPRPARDPNFLIRKTQAKGKISRNRAGQRLPPEDQS